MTIRSGLLTAAIMTAGYLLELVSLVVTVVVVAALIAVGAYIIWDARRGREHQG